MKRGCMTMLAGLVLIAAAVLLTVYNLTEQRLADESSASVAAELSGSIQLSVPQPVPVEPEAETAAPQVLQPPFVLHPEMQMPEAEIEENFYIGVLDIPSLQLSLPVMSSWSYKQLKIAPCRYTGSLYSHDLVICGHNYDRHFGLLKNLSIGEEIRFTDMDGNVFTYSVCAQQSLQKTAVEEMIAQTGEWDLTLFTCTVGGKTRVTVRCRLENYFWNQDE